MALGARAPRRRAASTTGRASSTRCRRCCSSSSSCCRSSCSRSSSCRAKSPARTRRCTRLNRQIEELTALLALERARQGADAQAKLVALYGDARADRRTTRARLQGLVDAEQGRCRRGRRPGGAAQPGARRRKAALGARAGAGRYSQPADRGAAPPARGASRTRSTPPRSATGKPGARSPISARASTSRSPRRCRSWRAIAPTSSAACARSSATGRASASSATVSSSNPKCCSTPARPSSTPPAARETRQARRRARDLEREIPPDIPWVLRVDGHTDKRPDRSGTLQVELGAVRRRAPSRCVQYLDLAGVSPQRLVAAGFGEFQPIDTGDSEEALRRNRRIELKLTER